MAILTVYGVSSLALLGQTKFLVLANPEREASDTVGAALAAATPQ